MIHLITEKPDPPAQCAAAARDNSANARPRACIRSQLINTRVHCLRDKAEYLPIYLSNYIRGSLGACKSAGNNQGALRDGAYLMRAD